MSVLVFFGINRSHMGSSTTTAYLRQFACVLPSSACCVKKKRLFKIPNLRFQCANVSFGL